MELWELSNVKTGEYAERLSGHYYQITSLDGKILSRSPSLGLADATLPIVEGTAEPVFQTVTGPDNVPLRLLSRSVPLTSTTLIIEIGDALNDTYSLLDSFRNIIVVVLPIIFMFSSLAGLIITWRALRPLKTFSSEIGHITEENLNTRIEKGDVVTELRPLVESFNTMLTRIEGAFARQQQFLSDASHELRTPTSIIKSYCDVTLRKERTGMPF
jgi:signal transduction histidine kinase